jgi:activator of HSP90 ATPase
MLSLDSSFSLEADWFKGIIFDAENTSDIKLMKRVYKETNIIVRETLTPSLIEPLNKVLKEKFNHNIADEMELETATIQTIIKRGIIRNDREFEIVKRREEEIYADESQYEYAETLRNLMSDYE